MMIMMSKKEKKKKEKKPWLEAELEYLSNFHTTKNNAKLSGRLSVMRDTPRSPKAVADKLSFLGLTRTSVQKRAVCGVGYGKRCRCCLCIEEECQCRFVKHKRRKLPRVYLCHEHSEFVWLD